MAQHFVAFIFDGEVPTLTLYSRVWGEAFRLSALTAVLEQIRGRVNKREGAGSNLVRLIVSVLPPVGPAFFSELAGKIEETFVMPNTVTDEAVEVEIILPAHTERMLIVPGRNEDLEQIRAACTTLQR